MCRSAKRAVERYRSPKDGTITTMRLPWFLGCTATCSAANTTAPDEIPTKTPSCVASLRAVAMACSPGTHIISLMTSSLRLAGLNPAPIPWILCGPGFPPDKTFWFKKKREERKKSVSQLAYWKRHSDGPYLVDQPEFSIKLYRKMKTKNKNQKASRSEKRLTEQRIMGVLPVTLPALLPLRAEQAGRSVGTRRIQ